MKLLTALLIALPIVSYADAPKLRYNWVQKEWHYAPSSAKLQYNWTNDKYEFVAPNSKFKYNHKNDSYEYVQSQISNPYKSELDQ